MAEQEDDDQRELPRSLRQRPATPIRPAAPASSLRPAEPVASAAHDATEDEPAPAPAVVDDDDTMAIPAPPPEAFAARPPVLEKKRPPVQAELELRRTLIPILLTLGVSLPIVGAWWFTRGPESPIRAAGLVLPIVMFIVGAVLLLLAVLNMLQVRAMLHPPAKNPEAPPEQAKAPR